MRSAQQPHVSHIIYIIVYILDINMSILLLTVAEKYLDESECISKGTISKIVPSTLSQEAHFGFKFKINLEI